MQPVVLLYIYPFLALPPFSPRLYSSPVGLHSARQHVTIRAEGIPPGYFPPLGKSSKQLVINFPVPSTSQYTRNENDFCFTFDGRTGSCRQRQQCHYFVTVKAPWSPAEIITPCRPDRSLICCPGQPRQFQFQPPKPYSSSRNVLQQKITQGNQAPVKSTGSKLSTPKNVTRNLETSCKESTLVNPCGAHAIKDTSNPPSLNVLSDFDFESPDAQKVCGICDPKQRSSWPWIVSIGHKYSNDTIEWACLGSLITTQYILTTAHCLQRSPTVVAVGQAFAGVMTAQELGNDISSVAESIQMNKYNNSAMYKNVGLVRLAKRVHVSSRVSPICFPFLAGVLDIIEFSGSDVRSLSLQFTAPHDNSDHMQKFEISDYRVVNNTFCSSTAKHNSVRLKQNFPKGIKQEVMCISPSNTGTLTARDGAPLVLYDQASDACVIIGISMGVSTPGLDQANMLFYTRVNAFSSWVRDNVGELPTPVPCYV
ncbi:unnamed protein product [Allacma fusca]|uniref:Peptidase S1 domain-containing protein n=1 Tax=Allacma fusca TaxID=39272 RepID=A0A8J2KEW1_9HEXA|nr:unnamed protein product [Allacma fusca]